MSPRSLIALACVLAAATPALSAASAPTAAERIAKARFETFNRHDLEAVVALYAPDAVLTSPGFCQDRIGLAGARQAYAALFQTVPDIQDQVTAVVIDREHIAIQFVARSTRPGAAFEVRIANFLTLDHGLIKRDDAYYDAKGRPCS
ncbi:MAG TPA: nuclear transport factor 2 family protein [Aliidongia sp.]|uniref:nuclear transport factor 2 family protein n=1 Tax=Aliidongia sp. TaxID=1914230 RepID=UPI002DDD3C26|nr:nuclear transport factor 2 family protein [Aliidongia sp.]HEV2678190.1 nuclear transport factor 2 family protein [Aliidongia sp.]